MNLKTICMNNIVEHIKNLPVSIQEEVINNTTKSIKEEAEKKAKQNITIEMRRSATIIINDITELLISSHQTGKDWERPSYTYDISDELYNTFVDVAKSFVNNYGENIIFHCVGDTCISRRQTIYSSESEYDDE
jgi:hypothetical protein